MIKNAHIHFNDLGTPFADDFGDIYFSNDDGLAESHYVFYEQNNIETRLQTHEFVIEFLYYFAHKTHNAIRQDRRHSKNKYHQSHQQTVYLNR